MEIISEERERSLGGPRVFETLIIKDDRITHKWSHLLQGTNEHSGKTWARFEDVEAHSYVFSAGRVRVFKLPVRYKSGGGWRTSPYRDITSEALSRSRFGERGSLDLTLIDRGFISLTGKTRNECLDEIYPLAQSFYPQDGVTPHLAAKDIQEFTTRVVGKKNYRKDVVKALAAPDKDSGERSSIAVMALATSGLIPVDWFVRWASPEQTRFWPMWDPHPKRLKEMLKTASTQQLRRLMFSEEVNYQGLSDIVRGFNNARRINPGFALNTLDFRSWGELERVLTGHRNRYARESISIEYSGKAAKFPGEYEGLQVIAPQDSQDLIGWSKTMGNCISGYDYSAANNNTLLYAAIENGKMVANMELDPRSGNVRQLLGPFNQTVKPEMKTRIGAAIHSVWPKAKVDGGWQ